jgi:hypothetical protein
VPTILVIRAWARSKRSLRLTNPGRVAAGLLFVVGSLREEDGAEIASAEAMDSELAVVNGRQ